MSAFAARRKIADLGIETTVGDPSLSFWKLCEWMLVEYPQMFGAFLVHTTWYRFPYLKYISNYWRLAYAVFNYVSREKGFCAALFSIGSGMALGIGFVMTYLFGQMAIMAAPVNMILGDVAEKEVEHLLVVCAPTSPEGWSAIDERIVVAGPLTQCPLGKGPSPQGAAEIEECYLLELPRYRPFFEILPKLARAKPDLYLLEWSGAGREAIVNFRVAITSRGPRRLAALKRLKEMPGARHLVQFEMPVVTSASGCVSVTIDSHLHVCFAVPIGQLISCTLVCQQLEPDGVIFVATYEFSHSEDVGLSPGEGRSRIAACYQKVRGRVEDFYTLVVTVGLAYFLPSLTCSLAPPWLGPFAPWLGPLCVAACTFLYSMLRTNHRRRIEAHLVLIIAGVIYAAAGFTLCERRCGWMCLAGSLLSILWRIACTGKPAAHTDVRTYQDLSPTLATGDLVLFGSRGLVSRTLQFLTKCNYSHVAMIVKDPPKNLIEMYQVAEEHRDPDGLYVFESYPIRLPFAPALQRKLAAQGIFKSSGPQLTALKKRLKFGQDFQGDWAAFRQLQMDDKDEDGLHRFATWAVRENYTTSLKEVAGSIIKLNMADKDTNCICTGLMLQALQSLGACDALSASLDVGANFLPEEFAEGHECVVPLSSKAVLRPEVGLKKVQ